MIVLAAEGGYRNVSIARISAYAGVSSATFYEQFPGKEECMLTAYRAAAERIFSSMRASARDSLTLGQDWSALVREALAQLLGAVHSNPHAARVLFVEGLGGGPLVRTQSRKVLDRVEQRTDETLDSIQPGEHTLDLPSTALIGAVRNIVARRLRVHAEDRLPLLVDDLVAWIRSYEVPAGNPRWSTGPDALLDYELWEESTRRMQPPAASHTRLPRGRHRLTAGAVLRSHRTRVIAATAEVTMAKGYPDTTVADIVAAAGVSRDVFYEHFTDKQHAFLEAQHHPTQYILDRCAAAYFQGREWPERLWNHLDTLIRMIVENPAISHLRLVECYAAGPAAIRRAEEITRAFHIFLEEGYTYGDASRRRPRLFSEAITGAIYEVIQRHVARGDAAQKLPERLPQLLFIGLAPFVGASQAIDLAEEIPARRLTVQK